MIKNKLVLLGVGAFALLGHARADINAGIADPNLSDSNTNVSTARMSRSLSQDIIAKWYFSPADLYLTFNTDGSYLAEDSTGSFTGTFSLSSNNLTFSPTISVAGAPMPADIPITIENDVLTFTPQLYFFNKVATDTTSQETPNYDVTVTSELLINIPRLNYQGSYFSAKMDFNGSCWVARDVTALSGIESSSDEVIVSTELMITIPKLSYQGSYYSAKLDHNGSCWTARDIEAVADSTTNTSSSTAIRATFGHNGFDFSENEEPTWENTDLYTVWWTNYTYPAGYKNYDGVWATNWDSSIIPVQDQGMVSLDSVTTIPTDWTSSSDMIVYPLQLDHVYISKTRDGYVKFKVLALPALPLDPNNIGNVEIEVEYVYTSGNSF